MVLGSDHVASAVAHRLHGDGFAVVLVDRVDPPWPRRGMAFTDAWYFGAAALAGLPAVFCASVRSIPSVLDRGDAIAATTWSWTGVAGAISPVAMIDTRSPSDRHTPPERARTSPLIAIEIVPGAVAGPGFDVAVDLVPEPDGPRERSLFAPCTGRFSTTRSIGDAIRAGEIVGSVGSTSLASPLDGCLRGLSARGARIGAGREVAEIDPRGEPQRCFGIEVRSRSIAEAVSIALARERLPAPRVPA